MMVFLSGVVIAALVFSAFLWSLYRAVSQTGALRAVQAFLAVSTVMVVASVTWDLQALLFSSGLTCALLALIAIFTEKRWNRLLPVIQLVLGAAAVFAGYNLLTVPGGSGPPLL